MHSSDAQGLQLRAEVKESGGQAYINSLYEWLTDDDDAFRAAQIVTLKSNEQPGEMTGSFDTVVALTEQVTALGSLILAYLTWRKAISPSPESDQSITVRVDVNGTSIEMSGLTETQIVALVESLRQDEIDMPNRNDES
ncbi:effector-associated constant component EACC1 [Streptomyces sp. NPDC002308]